jgi:hypothetical protein
MTVTKKKIEQLARALFPRYGIHDVGNLVATIVKYRNNDGYVVIGRPEGRWSWHAARGSTVVTPSRVTLAFAADYRRNAEQAREDLYRQLEDAAFSVMSEDEVELAMKSKPGKPGAASTKAPPSLPKTPPAQLEREIADVLAASKTKVSGNLGKVRAEHLATALRVLGHEAEAFRQYDQWNAVGVHRVRPGTAGTWRHIVSFTADGKLVPFAGGGRGNPWRGGPEHRAVEEAASWHP